MHVSVAMVFRPAYLSVDKGSAYQVQTVMRVHKVEDLQGAASSHHAIVV